MRDLPTSTTSPPARRPPPPWLWPAAVLAAGSAPLCALLALLAIDPAFVVVALRAVVLLLLAALAAALALALLWLYRRAQRAAVVIMQHGQPVHVADLRALTVVTAAATLERHYAVEQARAERSMFPALSHYSVRGEQSSPKAVAAFEGEVVAAPVASAPHTGGLAQLRERGQICHSDRALLVGHSATAPAYIDMRWCGFLAIGGQSRTGKTTTAALLIAQAALMGWDIAVCDPFPNKPDGLLARCRPISGAFFRQAATPEEIAATIRLVDKIGRRRLDGDRWSKPLLLVIEEFSNIAIRRMLPADVLDLLPAMAMAYAAVGVHGALVAHELSRPLLGERYGATLRRALTHRIAHRLAPDAAEYLLPSPAYARQVSELAPGQAILWGDESPALVRVPEVDEQDLRFAAQGCLPRPYAPRLVPSIALPSTAPVPPPSLDDRIVELLTASGQPLDGNAIAAQLGADLQQVRNALTRLTQAGQIVRHGQPRSYSYSTGGR